MDAFFQITAARRLLAFQQVDETMGLQAVSVEKDFWACWTLRELFSLPGIGNHPTFKGGTSLSKAWKLIERFSEDIDIIVDKEALGFGGDAAPDLRLEIRLRRHAWPHVLRRNPSVRGNDRRRHRLRNHLQHHHLTSPLQHHSMLVRRYRMRRGQALDSVRAC